MNFAVNDICSILVQGVLNIFEFDSDIFIQETRDYATVLNIITMWTAMELIDYAVNILKLLLDEKV